MLSRFEAEEIARDAVDAVTRSVRDELPACARYRCTRRCVLILLPDRYVAAHRRSVFALLVDELQFQRRFARAPRTKDVREVIPWRRRRRPAGLPGVRRRDERSADADADDPVRSGWCTEREFVATPPGDANARGPGDTVDHGSARIRVIGATLEDTDRFPFARIRSCRSQRLGGFRGAGDGEAERDDEYRPHGNDILMRRTLLSHEDAADLQHAIRRRYARGEGPLEFGVEAAIVGARA